MARQDQKLVKLFSAFTVIGVTLSAFSFSEKHSSPTPELNINTEENFAYAYVGQLIQSCGLLCRVDAGTFSTSLFFERRELEVDCKAIFGKDVFIQFGHGLSEPPRTIPDSLLSDFTLNGKIKTSAYYFNQLYLSKTASTALWSTELVSNMISNATVGILKGGYGVNETNHLRSALRHAPGVLSGRVLVIGSENPWVEACVIEAGAQHVVTLEYGAIDSQHPQVSTLTPENFQQQYNSGKLGSFDAIVTFSSVEHSGLGRYGDALNPWGDVLEIARAHCLCKRGGSLVLAVMYGEDVIEYNAHRRYGPVRWPYLATNWRQLYREDEGTQLVHVFQKD